MMEQELYQPGDTNLEDAFDALFAEPEEQQDTNAAEPDSAQDSGEAVSYTHLGNENAAMNHRLDAAKEVLNRVYGKSTQPIDGEVDAVLQILFSDEAEEYAK